MFFLISNKNLQECMNTKYLMVKATIRRLHLFENQYRRSWIVNKVVNKKKSESIQQKSKSFFS